MWKLTRLFSFLLMLTLAFSQQITREFDVKVELVGKVQEDKPKLSPPNTLPLPQAKELNLSSQVLEAPKRFEFQEVIQIKTGAVISCGEPKDALSYRLGVDYYTEKRYKLAQEELGRVLLFPNSPFKPMAEYVLGIIAYSNKELDKALHLFKNSCQFTHMYQKSACESYYALHLVLKNSVPDNKDPMWQAVKALKENRESKPQCAGAVFSQYCQYISDFAEGKENPEYKDSTLVRSGILAYFRGDLKRAKSVFSQYSTPGRPYRDVAFYYLALLEYKEGKGEQALKHASLLETLNPSLARELYPLLSERNPYLSRLAYAITRDVSFLEKAGVLAYNSGDYPFALRNFLEASSVRYAVYSAIKMGDYKTALRMLREKRAKDREDYLWLLEALYWSGEDMSETLSEVSKLYPELHKEYTGWERFRRGDWAGALPFFEDPYYRAVTLFNLKKYREAIQALQGRTDYKSNLLKARSAIMLGEPELARSFLTDRSGEELYFLGLSYFLESKYARAVSLFEKVPADSPVRAKALLKAGEGYYNMGMTSKAREAYYEVLRRFPDSEEARQATIALLDFAGKDMSDEEMERLLQNFIAKEQNPPPEMLYQYATLQIRKGNKKEAERQLLRLLDTSFRFKATIKLAELEDELAKKRVLLYKVYREAELEEDRNLAREELIKSFTYTRDHKSLADILAEGKAQDKVRAVSLYLSIGDDASALSVSRELMKENYREREFEGYLLELYKKTGDASLVEYLSKSLNKDIKGQAVYLLGMEELKKGNKQRALEYMVEVSLNYKGEPYYNTAVLEGAKILIEMGARRDASCMLDRFDLAKASSEESRVHSSLKQELPKCEVR
ncbi:MAG: tetratricopeptide repeat protein [Aquificaceae bacterium]|nr:tetratricopeptide repeat protein [Aquificaceae bacterium]